MTALLSFVNKIRIPENHDWVIFSLIGCAFALIFALRILQRNSGLVEFITQKYEDASNRFQTWILISVVYCVLLSVLISQLIPTIPEVVEKWSVLGISLNKFGFTLSAVSLFFMLKTFFGYFFYQSIGNARRWPHFYFWNTKLHFVFSLLIIVLCIMHYYYVPNRFIPERETMLIYYLPTSAVLFLFKIVYYLLHNQQILPQKWYYKFLYICTLQTAPALVLLKVLFI